MEYISKMKVVKSITDKKYEIGPIANSEFFDNLKENEKTTLPDEFLQVLQSGNHDISMDMKLEFSCYYAEIGWHTHVSEIFSEFMSNEVIDMKIAMRYYGAIKRTYGVQLVGKVHPDLYPSYLDNLSPEDLEMFKNFKDSIFQHCTTSRTKSRSLVALFWVFEKYKLESCGEMPSMDHISKPDIKRISCTSLSLVAERYNTSWTRDQVFCNNLIETGDLDRYTSWLCAVKEFSSQLVIAQCYNIGLNGNSSFITFVTNLILSSSRPQNVVTYNMIMHKYVCGAIVSRHYDIVNAFIKIGVFTYAMLAQMAKLAIEYQSSTMLRNILAVSDKNEILIACLRTHLETIVTSRNLNLMDAVSNHLLEISYANITKLCRANLDDDEKIVDLETGQDAPNTHVSDSNTLAALKAIKIEKKQITGSEQDKTALCQVLNQYASNSFLYLASVKPQQLLSQYVKHKKDNALSMIINISENAPELLMSEDNLNILTTHIAIDSIYFYLSEYDIQRKDAYWSSFMYYVIAKCTQFSIPKVLEDVKRHCLLYRALDCTNIQRYLEIFGGEFYKHIIANFNDLSRSQFESITKFIIRSRDISHLRFVFYKYHKYRLCADTYINEFIDCANEFKNIALAIISNSVDATEFLTHHETYTRLDAQVIEIYRSAILQHSIGVKETDTVKPGSYIQENMTLFPSLD